MQKYQPCSQPTFSLSRDVIFLMVSTLLGRFLVSFNLQSAVCGLQSAVFGLQSAVCSLQSAACKCHTPVPGQLTSSLYYLHSPSKSSVLDSFSTIKHSNFQIILAHQEVFGLMAGVQRPDPVFVSHSAQLCLHLKNKTVALRVKRSITED